MNIWRTSIPTAQDFPIWAFTDNDSEVVLLRYHEDFSEPITWCHASIPQAPRTHIKEKFDELAESTTGQIWTTYRWFEAGYRYGVERSIRTGGCNKSQAKSPFVSPEEYWDEPYESAYDEKP